MKAKFKPGDYVLKKSGGIPMTVQHYVRDKKSKLIFPIKSKYVKCYYHDVYGKKSEIVHENFLESVIDRNNSLKSVSNFSIRNKFLTQSAY